jgi:selenocysteine lyase/cysteine desulfurase
VTLLDRGAVLGATVTFDVAGRDADDVKRALAGRGVNVSVMEQDSAQLDWGARGIASGVRASVHYYNDDNDLDRLVEGVRELT